jgi:Ni/Co efflux regulator RcnB
MKPFAIASVLTALGMAAVLGASAAQAQGFASYGAYLPTHEYFGYADYGFAGYRPLDAERRFAPSPSGYDPENPGYSGWRRGDRLPEDYMTEVVDDYASAHLRKPPRGYAWFRDADDYILASENTGLITRVIHEE